MRSEDEILDALAAAARRDVAESMRGMREALKHAADPNPWLAAYPLHAMAAATAAGLFTGWKVTGRKRRARGVRAERPQPRRVGRAAGGLLSLLTLAASRMAVPAMNALLRGLTQPNGHPRSNGRAQRRAPPERNQAGRWHDPLDD